MTQTIVIAEMNNNTVHPSTAELVSAAKTFGGEPTLVVPCTDAGQAGGAAGMGAGNIIAAKAAAFEHYDASGWAEALDAVVPKAPYHGRKSTTKDLAARLAAPPTSRWFRTP